MNEEHRESLLRLARDTIRAHLADHQLPAPPDIPIDETQFGGAFVTLKNRGRLRGCIGRFNPDTDLPTTVQRMALSALEDPRFRDLPVTLDELPRITIEISILSPMRLTDDPASLRVGIDGIFLRQAGRSGCFLPQVATEQRWNAEEFLSRCCAGKAGLPADAWKDPEMEVYLFTAEAFAEPH
jgi:AmmeMemoRadiSam system protein A